MHGPTWGTTLLTGLMNVMNHRSEHVSLLHIALDNSLLSYAASPGMPRCTCTDAEMGCAIQTEAPYLQCQVTTTLLRACYSELSVIATVPLPHRCSGPHTVAISVWSTINGIPLSALDCSCEACAASGVKSWLR